MAMNEVSTSAKRYTEELKIEAAKQVTERGFPVSEVAKRLGVTPYSLYRWREQLGPSERQMRTDVDQHDEIRRLKAELRRITEEPGIPKLRHTSPKGERKVRVPGATMPRSSGPPPCVVCRGSNLVGFTHRCRLSAPAREYQRLFGRISECMMAGA